MTILLYNSLQCCSLILIIAEKIRRRSISFRKFVALTSRQIFNEFGCGYGPVIFVLFGRAPGWEKHTHTHKAQSTRVIVDGTIHRFRSPFGSLLQEARHLLEASQWNVEDRVNSCQTMSNSRGAADSFWVGPLALEFVQKQMCCFGPVPLIWYVH